MGDVSPRAVVLPATPLLVPGVAGRTEVLAAVRRAALDALRGLPSHARVVVVAAGGPGAAAVRGPASASVAAFGVAQAWVDPAWSDPAWSEPGDGEDPARRAAGPGACVALLALGAAGHRGEVDVVELGPGADPATASDLGHALRAEGTAVVVADDPRCPALAAVLDGFTVPGGERVHETFPGEDGGRPYDVVRYAGP